MWLAIAESSNTLIERRFRWKITAVLWAYHFRHHENAINAQWVNVMVVEQKDNTGVEE